MGVRCSGRGRGGGGWSSSADIFMLSLLDNPILYQVVNISIVTFVVSENKMNLNLLLLSDVVA